MTELVASQIVVRRGERNILDAVSLQARSGDFIAIIGANGAGKSTLLSVLAGLLKPSSGTVRLDGRSLHAFGAGSLARRRAYLPQNPRCEWPLSVERLVALGLTPALPALGALPARFGPLIDRALADCDLVLQRFQPVTTLSGGELARAMLARALVGDPEVLLVDEPMAGLDPKHALDTANRLQRLALDGKIVIASIHDLTIAARYATRVLALRQGQIAGDGAAQVTLTPQLIRTAFDVEACVCGTGEQMYIDYAYRRGV